MKHRFSSPASKEIEEAIEYYETQQSGLGGQFLADLENGINKILTLPKAWNKISKNTRRCLLERFPYGIIYEASQEDVLIISIMNLRRHPDSWKKNR